MAFSLKKGLVVVNFEEAYDTINHMNLFNEAARELSKEYNNSSFEFNSSTFNLSNNIIQQRCSITPTNIVIEYDNSSGIDSFLKLTLSTLQVLRDKSILIKFNRIGFRTFWGEDYKSIQEASNALIKCFNIDNKIINKFGNCDNFRYGFTSYEDGYSTNYNFLSAVNKEIKINNGMQVSEEEKYCVLGDIDIFIDKECKYSSIFTYITNFSKITQSKLVVFESIIKGV